MTRRAPIFDRGFATVVFDLPSAYFVAHPGSRLTKKVVGSNPVRWHAVRTHAAEVPEWKGFDPDEDAGLFPADYTRGALVAAPHMAIGEALSRLEREHGGRAVTAAAFRVGNALVAAEIPGYQGNQLQPPEDVPGHRAAILGIGDRVLYATVGALHVEAHEFVGAEMVVASEPDYLQNLAVTYPTTPKL